MRLKLQRELRKVLKDSKGHIKKNLKKLINELKTNPYPPDFDIKKIKGYASKEDIFLRARIGPYRVFYAYNKTKKEITILETKHRSKAYKQL